MLIAHGRVIGDGWRWASLDYCGLRRTDSAILGSVWPDWRLALLFFSRWVFSGLFRARRPPPFESSTQQISDANGGRSCVRECECASGTNQRLQTTFRSGRLRRNPCCAPGCRGQARRRLSTLTAIIRSCASPSSWTSPPSPPSPTIHSHH